MPRDYHAKLISKSQCVLLEPLVQSYAILITLYAPFWAWI